MNVKNIESGFIAAIPTSQIFMDIFVRVENVLSRFRSLTFKHIQLDQNHKQKVFRYNFRTSCSILYRFNKKLSCNSLLVCYSLMCICVSYHCRLKRGSCIEFDSKNKCVLIYKPE